jgi:plastocyanin
MHTAIVHLTPILGAEKSKVPFYIAGGVLVAWALILALGIGLRNASFPSTVAAERAVMGISAVLVVVTVSMAIATSGGSESKATVEPIAKEGREAPSGSGASSLKEAADPEGQLSYTTKDLSAKAGKVTIAFTNASPLEHNLTIAQGSKVVGATPTFTGGEKALTLSLKAGTYTFYCTVPGHRAAGMEGKLTVQ